MSIDTREKRQSAYGAFHVKGIPPVTPNAANDQEWRQEVYWGYSGILASAPVVAIDQTVGFLSIIQSRGLGVNSLVTASLGVNSAMDSSQGVLSVLQSRGLGVTSSINSSKGVDSTI